MSSTTVDPAHWWSGLSVVLTGTELEALERTLAHEEGSDLEGSDLEGSDQEGESGEEPDQAERPALQEAVRSLTVRGVLDPDGGLGDDLLGTWLDVALSTRFSAGLLLRVRRTVPGRVEDGPAADLTGDPHARHGELRVHLTDGVACLEDALPGGVRLALAEPGQVAAAVVRVCVPEDASAAAGPAFTHSLEGLTRPAGALADALGRPTSLLRLLADVPWHAAAAPRRSGPSLPPPSCHLVALGPRGCWVADLPPGPRQTSAEFRPVSPAWVEDWVRARAAPFATQGTMAG